jgi:hypothetical protein
LQTQIPIEAIQGGMRLMVDGMSERAAAKQVGYEGHHSAMHRYWKGKINADGTKGRWGIEDYTGFNDAETKLARLKAIDELVPKELGRFKAYFTDGELDVFAATVTLLFVWAKQNSIFGDQLG